jgi:hypothetical protein
VWRLILRRKVETLLVVSTFIFILCHWVPLEVYAIVHLSMIGTLLLGIGIWISGPLGEDEEFMTHMACIIIATISRHLCINPTILDNDLVVDTIIATSFKRIAKRGPETMLSQWPWNRFDELST